MTTSKPRSAKDIVVKPISHAHATALVKKWHYSGKVTNKTQIHLGVFLDDRCMGVMQYGPSIDKRKLMHLVQGTEWHQFIELNRMAFHDDLPRNSESRALAISFRMLKKQYPFLKWIVSFADGCQCGDGTIYRASGFFLTQIKSGSDHFRLPDGTVLMAATITINGYVKQLEPFISREEVFRITKGGRSAKEVLKKIGAVRLEGHQLRYIYFLDPTWRSRLTVPVIPFSRIDEMGAGMYKGERRVRSIDSDAIPDQGIDGGASPTCTLQTSNITSPHDKEEPLTIVPDPV